MARLWFVQDTRQMRIVFKVDKFIASKKKALSSLRGHTFNKIQWKIEGNRGLKLIWIVNDQRKT